MAPAKPRSPQQSMNLLGVLFLGLLLGLLYTFLIPPWQHYDEPSQFEYAWLWANYPTPPQRGDYDIRMRREVAASMIEHGFFEDAQTWPNLLSWDEPASIGIPQTGDQPLYHWLLSLPLRLVRYTDITFQLYLTRLTSLIFLLATIIFCWGLVREISANPNSRTIWLVPLTMVLIPGFVDMMTSINNDVGAAAFFTLFLWGAIYTLKRGPRLLGILWISAAAILCYFTKTTVWISVALAPVVIFASFFRGRWKYIPIALLFIAGMPAFALVFGWGATAGWTTRVYQAQPTQLTITDQTGGNQVFAVHLSPAQPSQRIMQSLSFDTRVALKGKKVDLLGTAWATDSAALRVGFNSGSGWRQQAPFPIGQKATPFQLEIEIPVDAENVWVELTAILDRDNQDGWVYLDNIHLNLTDYSTADQLDVVDLTQTPVLDGNVLASQNLLANADFSRGWFRVRARAAEIMDRYFLINTNYVVYSLSSLRQTFWYYHFSADYLLQTFWARFGWGNVPLLGEYGYQILGLLSLLGVVGSGIWLVMNHRRLPWKIVFLLAFVIIFIWGQTMMRGISSLFGPIWLPAARYALPAIVPTVLVFVVGWTFLFTALDKKWNLNFTLGQILYILFFAGVNTLAVLSIVTYFYL